MLEKLSCYVARVSVFLITAALIVGMAGCDGYGHPSQNLEIQTWYDLDAVRNNLAGHHTLMNDLDSTTSGYEELASPTANGGTGWEPIAAPYPRYGLISFEGTFDGQGYKIRDLFIYRPDEGGVGLFCEVGQQGFIKDIGMMNVTVIGREAVGGLVGGSGGTVSNSYSSGNVTGDFGIGGLVGINDGTVSNSYFSGNVTGDGAVGGLMGINDGNVSNSYCSANVTGENGVGGLVGVLEGCVSNSYSTSSVTGDSSVGGLVGWNEGGIVSASFWDTETSGQATSDGGTGKNTMEMQYIATFSGAGWDIIAVAPGETNDAYTWNIIDKQTYPFLSWEP